MFYIINSSPMLITKSVFKVIFVLSIYQTCTFPFKVYIKCNLVQFYALRASAKSKALLTFQNCITKLYSHFYLNSSTTCAYTCMYDIMIFLPSWSRSELMDTSDVMGEFLFTLDNCDNMVQSLLCCDGRETPLRYMSVVMCTLHHQTVKGTISVDWTVHK